MFNQLVAYDRSVIKISLFWWPILCLLTACVSEGPVRRLPASAAAKIKSVRVVAIEAPPLEVTPDLLEERMPVYQQYENMAVPFDSVRKVYRNPGGIMIFGRVGQDDPVATNRYHCVPSFSCVNGDWMPTLDLSQQAAAQLDAMQIEASAERSVFPLPPAGIRGAGVDGKRKAIEQWYRANRSVLDSRQLQKVSVDAVLEIGMGHYKLFAGQLTVQLMIKLVDPRTGQVIARGKRSTVTLDTSTQALLAYDGAALKTKLREVGMQLLVGELQALGLPRKRKPTAA